MRRLAALGLAVLALAACSSTPIPPTYTEEELRQKCERARGWWKPDQLRGGYCEHDSQV